MGGEHVILIYVLDSVTYNLSENLLIYLYSSVQRRAKQPRYNLNYSALIRYKFILTYVTIYGLVHKLIIHLHRRVNLNIFSRHY